jgi:A/G-specific adenine glycosylase
VFPDDNERAIFGRRLKRWGAENRRVFPWRETSDPFRILVTEILLQRSRGRTVATAYEELFRRWPDAHTLSRARTPSISSVIRPLGLVKRAETLKSLAAEVVRLGSVPDTLDGLLALPGVGRYAASATLAVGFGKRTPVVDGVSARVYRRYFGLEGDGPASADTELWQLVERATPRTHVREWNWAVLDLAAKICLPKVPRCSECPLETHCAWSQHSLDLVGGKC